MFQSEILTGVIRCDKLDTETAESGDEMSEVRKHFVVHGKVQGEDFVILQKYLCIVSGTDRMGEKMNGDGNSDHGSTGTGSSDQ